MRPAFWGMDGGNLGEYLEKYETCYTNPLKYVFNFPGLEPVDMDDLNFIPKGAPLTPPTIIHPSNIANTTDSDKSDASDIELDEPTRKLTIVEAHVLMRLKIPNLKKIKHLFPFDETTFKSLRTIEKLASESTLTLDKLKTVDIDHQYVNDVIAWCESL